MPTAIDTAYPRLKAHPTAKELASDDERSQSQARKAVSIPAWIFALPARFFRSVERIAQREKVPELEMMQHALKRVQDEHRKAAKAHARGGTKEETIFLHSLGMQVPLSKARQVTQEISRHFGGLTRLSPEARKARAKKAAEARWGKGKKKA